MKKQSNLHQTVEETLEDRNHIVTQSYLNYPPDLEQQCENKLC